ncbi:MAG TPA: dTDP-4-dehydrorhamnose reductase [Thermomicrobiales bacterium]|nr:dTDP-4-dehydrorhamnose reductase [Thermomicrobiales bacterium]
METNNASPPHSLLGGQRIVVTGAGGQLGTYLVRAIADAGGTPIGFGHRPGATVDTVVDIVDAGIIAQAIADAAPDAIIHAAAMTDVDGCERDPEQADRVNHLGTKNVAQAAAQCGAYLVAVSTDFVFPGTDAPYSEDAVPGPLSVYGTSKRAGEIAVLEASDTFAVARTAWVYGGQGKHFPRTVLNVLAARPEIEVVEDERGNPTFAGDLAEALVSLVGLRLPGIVHLTNAGTTSRFSLAREVATQAGLDPQRVQPTTVAAFLEKYPLPAPRPADSALLNTRAATHHIELRSWQEALAAYMPRLVSEFPPNPTPPERAPRVPHGRNTE